MERLTEEHKFGVFASIKDKKLAQVGAFKDYETFYAVMIAMNKLYEYENTGLDPKEVEQLKVNQNKLAIEKLKEALEYLKINGVMTWETDKKPYGISEKITDLIAELKGVK